MRLLICGSRGWHDPDPITTIIAGYALIAEESGQTLTLIHGAAPGADTLADRIGKRWGVEIIREPADWGRYGAGAGPRRNQKMLDEHKPDVVYAFRSTGKSNGTDDMVTRARKSRTRTYVVNEAS